MKPKPDWVLQIEANRADVTRGVRREVQRALGEVKDVKQVEQLFLAVSELVIDVSTRLHQMLMEQARAPQPAPAPQPVPTPRSPQQPAWVDTKGASKILDIAVSKLEAWRSKGGGPPFTRVGPRIVRYNVEQLNAWMASQ